MVVETSELFGYVDSYIDFTDNVKRLSDERLVEEVDKYESFLEIRPDDFEARIKYHFLLQHKEVRHLRSKGVDI